MALARTLTVFTTAAGVLKNLGEKTQLVLTITPRNCHASVYPIAWKVWTFGANSDQEHSANLPAGYRVSKALMPSQCDWVIIDSSNSAGIGPNQYLAVSDYPRWESNQFFDACNEVILVNNSSSIQSFAIGSRPSYGEYDALLLLKALDSQEGLAFQLPSILRVFVIPECSSARVFSKDELDSLVPLQSIDIESLLNDTRWHLYTGESGLPVLEDVSSTVTSDTPSLSPPDLPNPLSAVSNGEMLLGQVLMLDATSAPTPSPPGSPGTLGSPGFAYELLTPPMTPEPDPPGLPPIDQMSPSFGSPLL